MVSLARAARLGASLLFITLAGGACENLLSSDRGEPNFPDDVVWYEQIEPRESWIAVYPDLRACVAALDAPVVRLDKDFSDLRWYDGRGECAGSTTGCYSDGDILLLCLGCRPERLEFWVAVHEMTHHHVSLTYDDDFGHTHPAFDQCNLADLRPGRFD